MIFFSSFEAFFKTVLKFLNFCSFQCVYEKESFESLKVFLYFRHQPSRSLARVLVILLGCFPGGSVRRLAAAFP